MAVFLISDIFGKTLALKRLCEHLFQKKTDIEIIDPYGDVGLGFESETLAYEYFMDQVGLDNYCDIIQDRLKMHRPNTILIGFSIGASAVWRLSQNNSLSYVKKAVCYYGSQIRYFMDVHPCFDVELIFPDQESHFNIDLLIDKLKETPHVSCQKTFGNHGFMNELSQNYDPSLYTKHTKYLSDILS